MAAIIATLISIFTGSLFGALLAIAVILIVELIIEVISGKKAGNQLSNSLSNTPLPDALTSIGVDIESRFNNPIEISPGGVLLSGTAIPVSRFFELDDTQARAGGPYEAVAGTPLQLNGGLIADDTDYSWFPGDSFVELTERAPTYTYGALSYQIAALETFNRQFESGAVVRNRHLALVRVNNTVPAIWPVAPINGLEGEEIEITAQFTDRSWLDTHTAYVLFGDRTAPVIATVTESNAPPATTGTITARHTYCDNGEFTVTIKVIDEQGGSQTIETTATIQNVPPIVDAGPDQFAYPCVPTRLVGHFEDQGWCDTHTATWNFGDCSPLLSATIEETNEPPQAIGTATGTHCYRAAARLLQNSPLLTTMAARAPTICLSALSICSMVVLKTGFIKYCWGKWHITGSRTFRGMLFSSMVKRFFTASTAWCMTGCDLKASTARDKQPPVSSRR